MTEQFRAVGLHGAMHVIPVLCLALAVVLYASSRTVEHDMARLRAGQESQPKESAA
jgi:hypothetical protein